jgi:hypothetical protein
VSKGGFQRLRRGCLSHDKIRPLSPEAKLVWFWAVSEGGLCCLLYASVRHVAQAICEDWTDAKAKRGLLELQAGKHVLWDQKREIVWLIEGLDEQADLGPKLAPAVLRKWRELPGCQIKIEFAKRYRAWLDLADRVSVETGDTVSPETGHRVPTQTADTVTHASGRTTSTSTSTPLTGEAPAPKSKPRKPKAPKQPAEQDPTCVALWELQGELRREAIPGARALLGTTLAMGRIAKILALGYTPADCEAVLRVYASRSADDPEQAVWFDGVSNWRPENFERTLGRAPSQPEQPDAPRYLRDRDGLLFTHRAGRGLSPIDPSRIPAGAKIESLEEVSQ